MITTSDLIRKLLKDKGHTPTSFCRENGLDSVIFTRQLRNNMWTEMALERVGKGLGVDLSRFVNACQGVPNGGRND